MTAMTAVLVGAGERGAHVYGAWAAAHPADLKIVAVAEPDPIRRAKVAAQHAIPLLQQFDDWQPLFAQPQLADAALICTQDTQHVAPTLAALQAGYHVLLEKPMATTAEDCVALVQAAAQAERQLHVAHVLRYTRHFQSLREILETGDLGQLVTVDHRENVSWWHMTHSFVRGNWRRLDASSPMLLAKCCHDLDILGWLLGERARTVSSSGQLRHYRAENRPLNAPPRCTDGCPVAESCPYFAPFIYIEMLPLYRALADGLPAPYNLAAKAQVRAPGLVQAASSVLPMLRQLSDYRGWPRSVVAADPSPANLMAALQTGPYGRCVYDCDNDVVDHQVVLLEMENGLTATLTMHGHAHHEGRSTRIQGSAGELEAWFGTGGSWITTRLHRSGQQRRIKTSAWPPGGHGGGDDGLMQAFVAALRGSGEGARTLAAEALESHLLAFAAESARLQQQVVQMADFRPT